MAFLQQSVTYRRVVTPLMMKRELPPLRTVEQRMMLILLAVVLCILGMLGVLLQQTAQSIVGDDGSATAAGAESAGMGSAVANRAALVRGSGGISPLFTPEVRFWEADIVRWAAEHDLDPNMVATVMQIESCGDPNALSHAGARGLFQVMPFHFGAGEDHFDPDTNARRGMNYLVERLEQTGGDVGLAFAGYNGGHVAAAGSWNSWSHETQRYYVWSTGIYGEIQSGMSTSPTLERWLEAGGASLCHAASRQLGLN